MSEEVQAEEVVQDDAQALASAMAGYNKARGEEPPAEAVPPQQPEEVPAIEEIPSEDPPAEEPQEPSVAEELAALKAKVSALKDSHADAATVRRMHGEIGNINRTLQQLQQPQAPAKDDLAAALASAEAVAAEYPELAGPLVNAIKALSAKPADQAQPQEDIHALVEKRVTEERKATHKALLTALVPGWDKIVGTPDERGVVPKTEYRDWLATKPVEYQRQISASDNALEVKASIEAFKAETQERQRKQNKLAAAVVSKGTTQPAGPSVIPDEEGFARGYKKAKRLFG